MTTLGFFFMSLAYILMLFFDCSLTHDVPRWTYFCAAACIFIYQTLDACDGKQARKTKSSSPLGQLVDHGCDSFALNSQWYENHTKILKTNVGNLGVTEIEFILIGLLMVTGIFGREIWALTARQLMPSSLISLVETKFTNGRDFIDHPLYVYVYWSIVVVMIILNLIMVFTILLKQKNKTEQVLQFLPITIVVFLGKLCLKINIFRTFL